MGGKEEETKWKGKQRESVWEKPHVLAMDVKHISPDLNRP